MEPQQIKDLILKLEQLGSDAHTHNYYSQKGKNKKERDDAGRELQYVIDELSFIIRKNKLFELVHGENRPVQEVSEYFMTLMKYFKDDIRNINNKLKEKLKE
ncbi:MAG: hypothetical protein RSA74_13385 [Chryseobacterium sp.]